MRQLVISYHVAAGTNKALTVLLKQAGKSQPLTLVSLCRLKPVTWKGNRRMGSFWLKPQGLGPQASRF